MIPRWLPPVIALLGLASLTSLSLRFRVEQENRAVGILAEFDAVEELAATQGISLDAGLIRLRAAGLSGVVVGEQFVSDLLAGEQLSLKSTREGLLLEGHPQALDRVAQGVLARYPKVAPKLGPEGLTIPDLTAGLLRRTPIGIDPAECSFARSAGLRIVARHTNPVGATESYIKATLGRSNELGATILLPQGEQVLGRRENLDVTSATLKQLGMLYASAEFGRIGGDQNMVEASPDTVVRLHAAQAQELDKLPAVEAVDRYLRAAKERNQRLLLLRPLTASAAAPLDAFGEFVQEVKEGLVVSGFDTMAAPHPYRDAQVPRPMFVGIGLVAAPILYWVGCAFVRNPRVRIAGGVLILLLALACWTNTGRQFMALFAAISLPTAAFLMLDQSKTKSWLPAFAWMSGVSLVGGLTVAGLLNGLPYYVRADQFVGVKAAHFVPILLVGVYYFSRQGSIRESLSSPVRWMQAGLALVILASLAFMFTRTGNDNPAAVSGIELKFRELLDTILMVRPRTKELLIGHPLLIVGVAFLVANRAKPTSWHPVLMMAGAIGQTSIVNTLCHLHTPLTLSLARLGVGFVAGGILGAVLWGLVRSFVPAEPRIAAA